MDNLFPYPIARQSKTPPNYDMANLNDTLDPQEKTHPQADQASAKTWVQVKLNAWAVPAGLLVLLVVSFGLFIPRLGFYWDDWPVILTGRLFGASGFWQFYQYDRPFSAWTYILTFPILGSYADPLAHFYPAAALGHISCAVVDSHPRCGLATGAKALGCVLYSRYTRSLPNNPFRLPTASTGSVTCYISFHWEPWSRPTAFPAQNRRWFWPLTALSPGSFTAPALYHGIFRRVGAAAPDHIMDLDRREAGKPAPARSGCFARLAALPFGSRWVCSLAVILLEISRTRKPTLPSF